MRPSSVGDVFGEVLGNYLAETYTSVRRLAKLSGVSRRTIENWLQGSARRPRHWEPVLRVAHSLHLPASKTDALLRAAGLPTLAALQKESHSHAHAELLAAWHDSPPIPPAEANLPAPLTSFIGRAGELAGLVAALADPAPTSRLVTLIGEGGSGKTRLALQAAESLRPVFADGLWLVELDAVADPALVSSAIASALGLGENKNRPILATLVEFLAGRRALLLLDNCDHLVAAVAEVAGRLLRHCPQLLILATSRERLGVAGEMVWQVPAMALPPPGATDVAELASYDAVRLFVERAAAALPGFTLTEDNAAAVAQVCHRLDGIPLALELAAARVRLLRVEEIAGRLDDRFALLTGGSRALAPRQQTLRGLIDWSYLFLPPPEQRLLRRLSVFPGSFTLAAAEAVCALEDPGDPAGEGHNHIFAALSHLTDKSLVALGRSSGREARYSLHETIRHYSFEKLQAAGEATALQARHAAYYARLLEHALPRADYDDRWYARLAWLELEYSNWHAVLSRALNSGPVAPACGVRVAARLAPFWLMHGRLIEGRRWLEAALAQAEAAPPAVRAALYLWMATLMIREREPHGAALAARGTALFRELADDAGTAWGLIVLGLSDLGSPDSPARLAEGLALAESVGDECLQSGAHYVLARLALRAWSFDAAERHAARSLDLARQAGNRLREPYLLRILGVVASWQGNSPRAMAYYEDALALTQELKVQGWVQATIFNSLGEDARRRGAYDRALVYYRQAQEAARRIGDLFLVMGENLNIGLTLVRDEDVEQGEALLRADLSDRLGHERIDDNTAWNLWGLALAAARRGDLERAARLFGGVEKLSQSTDFPLAPVDRATYEADVAEVRAKLGDRAFTAAHAYGASLAQEEVFAFALDQ